MHNQQLINNELTEKIVIPFYQSRLNKNETDTGTEERSTETIIAESEVVRNQAEAAESVEEIESALKKLEDRIDSIDAKVVKLTESWDESTLPIDEQPGRQAGKAAKKEITKFMKEVSRLLNFENPVVNANIPPAGGEIYASN